MTTHIDQPTNSKEKALSLEEARALDALRVRFQEDQDLFTARERARLRFLRWMVLTGSLAP